MNVPSHPKPDATAYGTKGLERNFGWSHMLLRLVWNVTWLFLAAWTPPPLYAWRRLLLNLFGADIAKGARVYGSARVWYPPNLTMKKGAVLGWQAFAYTQDRITIEEDAIVSQWARIVTGTHEIETANFQLQTRPVVIGRHAWVAAGALVGPGVTVGEGAVLGGGAVAFKNLDPWTVYAGNPARAIKQRPRFLDAP